MSALRVGIVGAGYFGRFHYDAWSRMEDARIVGICVRNPEQARNVAAEFSVPSIYSAIGDLIGGGLDLLDITAPPETHLGMIEAAAGRVPWVICQKPFCRSVEEAEQAVRIAEAAGMRLAIHENFRHQPWYREIRRQIDAGAVGAPYQASFRLRPGDGQGPEAYLARQPYFQKMPRFLVRETAIHWIDTFRYLLGEATAVTARLRRLNPAIAGEDAGVILMEFESGAIGLFDGNRLSDHAAVNRRLTLGEAEIEGPDGALRLDGDARITHRRFGENGWEAVGFDWTDHLFGGDCVYLTNKAILEDFRAGRPSETEASAYLRNLAIEEAVYRSDAEGARVVLP